MKDDENKVTPEKSMRRNWKKYNKADLLTELLNLSLDLNITDVQAHWNYLENVIALVADKVAPMVEYTNGETTESTQAAPNISNFYSVLYYNSEVWLLPTLKASVKQKLLSVSSEGLRLCSRMDWTMSFETLHAINKRATPMNII